MSSNQYSYSETRTATPERPCGLGLALGFAQASDSLAGLPLTAFLQELKAFETLEHVAFAAQGGRRAETAML